MKNITRVLAAVALAAAGAASHAAVVVSTPLFSGDVRVSGFGIVTGIPTSPILPNTNTFTVDYTNLRGSLNFLALPNGNYTVSAGGTYTLTGFGPTSFTGVVPVTPVYSGYLGSSGLTQGPYNFSFGTASIDREFAFTLDYDGNASSQVMSALTGLGFPFVNSDGKGTLTVAGTFFANGTSAQLTFTESNLTWSGYANTLALADLAGGNNGEMDGSFSITGLSVTATAIPEPASLALVGTALLGLSLVRRRNRS